MKRQALITTRNVSAVRVSGSKGAIQQIPTNARLYRCGHAVFPNMVEVAWRGEQYAVFEADLEERTIATDE